MNMAIEPSAETSVDTPTATKIKLDPPDALQAVIHALVQRAFYGGHQIASCLDMRLTITNLTPHAPGIEESVAGTAMRDRHEVWGRQLPKDVRDLWAFVVGLDGDSRLSLLAHCAGLSVNALRTPAATAAGKSR